MANYFSEEGPRAGAAAFGLSELAGALERLGAVVGRHHGFHLHELLGLQRLDLVAGLGDLEIADGGLAVGDQPVEAFRVFSADETTDAVTSRLSRL